MTQQHDLSLLAASLVSLKAMIQRALEEQDEGEPIPKHSAAVIDRMTASYSEEKRLG